MYITIFVSSSLSMLFCIQYILKVFHVEHFFYILFNFYTLIMEIKINSSVLTRIIKEAAVFTNKKSPLPICSEIELTFTGHGIYINATDLQTRCEIYYNKEFTIEETKTIIVDPEIIINALAGAEEWVSIIINSTSLTINEKEFNCEFAIETDNDFPSWETNEQHIHSKITLPVTDLDFLINSVIDFHSTNELTPALTCVKIYTSASKCYAVTTDSHRLAESTVEADVNSEKDFNVLLFGSDVRKLKNILSYFDNYELVTLIAYGQDPKFIKVKIGTHCYFMKTAHNITFPKYESFWDTESFIAICLNKDELSKKIQKLLKLSNKESHLGKLNVQSDKLEIEVTDKERAINSKILCSINSTEKKSDSTLEPIGINLSYLQKIVNNIAEEEITFFIEKPTRYVIITSGNIDFQKPVQRFLIMPVMLNIY